MTTAKKAKPKPFDWDQIVDEPKRATDAIALCFRADLNGRHAQLTTELAALTEERKKSSDRRIGQADPRTAIAAEVESIEEEMLAATRTVELEAMRRKEFRALALRHPPRPGDDVDAAYNVNLDTCIPELLAECVTEPKRDAAFWTTLLDEVLNDRQYERLVIAVWNLNRRDVVPGFSELASAVTRRTNGSSPPRAT